MEKEVLDSQQLNKSSEKQCESKGKKFLGLLKRGWKYFVEEYIKFPLYILAHPMKGFMMFQREHRAKWGPAIFYAVAVIIINILDFQYVSIEIRDRDLKNLKFFAQITYIVGPILLYTFASWACTTILDGKGKLKEIFLMTCYSLFPLAWCSGIALALSNVLTGTELAIYRLIYALGYVLMGYMIFTGMITIHEFGLGKTLFSLILTLVAAIVIVFVILLMYELFQKMFGFLYTLYTEITQRDLLRFRK